MNQHQSSNAKRSETESSLVGEFQRIRREHQTALVARAARTVLGPSVIRVFAKGTRSQLMPVLASIDIGALSSIQSQEEFSKWFDANVRKIWRTLRLLNGDRASVGPGGQWGHSTKIMALFVRELVLHSRYFKDREVNRLSPLLYVPIDGIVMRHLKSLGVKLPFSRIREIESRKAFYAVQNLLAESATQAGVPRIWFDDIWGTRQTRSL